MIKVTFTYQNKKFFALEVKGHANSAPYGHDLVCAAVSGVLPGALNALELDPCESEWKESDGYFLFKAKKDLSEHDETVIETIYVIIEGLAEAYSKHLSLERKETP